MDNFVCTYVWVCVYAFICVSINFWNYCENLISFRTATKCFLISPHHCVSKFKNPLWIFSSSYYGKKNMNDFEFNLHKIFWFFFEIRVSTLKKKVEHQIDRFQFNPTDLMDSQTVSWYNFKNKFYFVPWIYSLVYVQNTFLIL